MSRGTTNLGGDFTTEEDEAAVAFDIACSFFLEEESLRDGGLHLPTSSSVRRIQLNKSAILPMHDEVSSLAALDGDLDEVVDVYTTSPR